MADIRKRQGKKGITYQVRYSNPGSKSGYSFATFKTMKEARAFAQNSTIWPTAPTSSTYSVADAVQQWLGICQNEGTDGNEPVTGYTLDEYRRRASRMQLYDWSVPLANLTAPDVVNFRSWLIENYTKDQARKTLSSFHTVLKEMTLRGHITSNPATGISIKSTSRYDVPVEIPTVREVAALLAAADRLANSKNAKTAHTWMRYRPMLYLACDSGMRPQELVALPKHGIEDKGVRILQALERRGEISVTKTRAGRRFIDISPETLDMVRHYAGNHAADSQFDLVFPTASGRWLTVENWRNRGFRAACKEAGLMTVTKEEGKRIERPKFTPYSLRHFFASMLIKQKLDLKKIQRLMGHEKIETTINTYGHLIEEEFDQSKCWPGMLQRLNVENCGDSVAKIS